MPTPVFTSKNRVRRIEPEPFEVDGETLWAMRPKEITVAKFAQATVDTSDPNNIPLLFQFLAAVFTEPSQRSLLARMDDPNDGFDSEDLAGLATMLLEHWGIAEQTKPAKKAVAKKTTKKA